MEIIYNYAGCCIKYARFLVHLVGIDNGVERHTIFGIAHCEYGHRRELLLQRKYPSGCYPKDKFVKVQTINDFFTPNSRKRIMAVYRIKRKY